MNRYNVFIEEQKELFKSVSIIDVYTNTETDAILKIQAKKRPYIKKIELIKV